MLFEVGAAVAVRNGESREPGLLESYSRSDSGLLSFEARGMGGWNALLLGGAPEATLRESAAEAFGTLERLEDSLSKFRASSDLSLLNALGASRRVSVGRPLLDLLARSREAWELTGGIFDPTVAPLLEAWGLVALEGRIPPKDEVAALRSRGGMRAVDFDAAAGVAAYEHAGVALDLGGIAKGYAADRLAAGIQARGVDVGAVILSRSSVVLWGSPGGEDSWRVDVVHPRLVGETFRTLRVEPGAVSTSSASERHFVRAGREYGHVIDPRTGAPARGRLGVTVWSETALLGDVASTVLYVAGEEALAPGGPIERVARAWTPSGREPRISVLLLEEDSAVWGGSRLVEWSLGRPAFAIESA